LVARRRKARRNTKGGLSVTLLIGKPFEYTRAFDATSRRVMQLRLAGERPDQGSGVAAGQPSKYGIAASRSRRALSAMCAAAGAVNSSGIEAMLVRLLIEDTAATSCPRRPPHVDG
jgi:hypothetical protein